MHDSSPNKSLQISLEKRILNEFASKILNEEKMDKNTDLRRGSANSDFISLPFHCECDDDACTEYISLSIEEYAQVHAKTRNFVVVPQHVRLDIEEVISSFPKYTVVGKYFPHPGRQ